MLQPCCTCVLIIGMDVARALLVRIGSCTCRALVVMMTMMAQIVRSHQRSNIAKVYKDLKATKEEEIAAGQEQIDAKTQVLATTNRELGRVQLHDIGKCSSQDGLVQIFRRQRLLMLLLGRCCKF